MIALPRATSSDKPPVVISHHEINSSPYQVFGANDPHGFYGDCGFKLVSAGFTVVAPATVLSTHLSEIIKKYAHEFLGRQEVQQMLENLL